MKLHIKVDVDPKDFVEGIKALLDQDEMNDVHYQIPDYQYDAVQAVMEAVKRGQSEKIQP